VSAAPRTRSVLDVFRYLDYRAYLRDLYTRQKARGLSYRAFSKRAKLGAPNYLKLVIDGDRNLTPAMAERFAEACGLSGEPADYFCALVDFNQAARTEARNAAYARLLAFRRYRDAHRLDAAHAEYHSTWWLPALRELIASPAFREDPAVIARAMIPPIKAAEVQKGMATLLKLGLVERDAAGKLRQTSTVVSTGPETQGMHIRNYHAEMMKHAARAMELVPAPRRDISSLTLCVSPRGLATLKRRIQEFRRELLALCDLEHDPSQVVQLNLQLFPLTEPLPAAGPDHARGDDDAT